MTGFRSIIPRLMIAAIVFITPFPRFAHSAVLYVAPNGLDTDPGTSWASSKKTIQAAIDAAAAGDTVLVSNGVYATGGTYLDTVTNRVVINKPITVQSVNGPGVTTIQGAKDPININRPGAVRCVLMEEGVLDGFTLANGATAYTYGSTNVGGGVYASSPLAVIRNCVLTGNSAFAAGGGAYSGTLINCLLTGNHAGQFGGGSYGSVLNNCIVEFNFNTNLMIVVNYYNGTFTHSCTTPHPGGTGNIINDPQFVDAGNSNFQLSATSPCINAGNNSVVQGITDLDGNPRILLATVDMGAYEFDGILPTFDSDLDGFTDEEEAVAGTNPNDSNSVWQISGMLQTPALQFLSVTGRLYGADYNTNLSANPRYGSNSPTTSPVLAVC